MLTCAWACPGRSAAPPPQRPCGSSPRTAQSNPPRMVRGLILNSVSGFFHCPLGPCTISPGSRPRKPTGIGQLPPGLCTRLGNPLGSRRDCFGLSFGKPSSSALGRFKKTKKKNSEQGQKTVPKENAEQAKHAGRDKQTHNTHNRNFCGIAVGKRYLRPF